MKGELLTKLKTPVTWLGIPQSITISISTVSKGVGDIMEKQTYVVINSPRGPVKVTVARRAGQVVYRIYEKL